MKFSTCFPYLNMGCRSSKVYILPTTTQQSQTTIPADRTFPNNGKFSLKKDQIPNVAVNNNGIIPERKDQTTKTVEEANNNVEPLEELTRSDDDAVEIVEKLQRREGIHAQGNTTADTADEIKTVKIDKDEQSCDLIRRAISNNSFLKIIFNEEMLLQVIDVMYSKNVDADTYIIKEGEKGSHLFVSASGYFEVVQGKERKVLKTFGEGEAFGELALLYNAKRLASVKVLKDAKLWVLDRHVFQKIVKRTGLQEQEDHIRFLTTVPLFQKLPKSVLAKISDLLKKEFFKTGTAIVQQGDKGDKFYIIRAGNVTIKKKEDEVEQIVGTLTPGNYFGELALIREDRRQATVIAQAPGVECLTLDVESFKKYLGSLDEITQADYIHKKRVTSEFAHIQLSDLSIIGTMGVGGFGRVELVRYKDDKSLTFALKYLKKIDIIQQQQEEHAYNEKNIMMSCNSRFICRLYQTYRDDKKLYFLMEACLGGDVWKLLQEEHCFDEKTSKFMAACVIEAFEYMHVRGFVYRDLKPENLMLDTNGYVKLVDFGFAKEVDEGAKTWTFAGTPEYVAPEIILNRGHNRAVDYWTLGIFIHELLTGKPPFRGKDHMKTYSLVLRGIDQVIFSIKIPRVVQNLIRKLCRQAPVERLGCQRDGVKDIKNHKWFMGFNWEALQAGTLPAPLVRNVASPDDLRNFDKYPPDDDDPPPETSGWDKDF